MLSFTGWPLGLSAWRLCGMFASSVRLDARTTLKQAGVPIL